MEDKIVGLGSSESAILKNLINKDFVFIAYNKTDGKYQLIEKVVKKGNIEIRIAYYEERCCSRE